MASAAIVTDSRLVTPAFCRFHSARMSDGNSNVERTGMIKSIKFVSVYVSDQDAALAFYTQKLGFTVVTDQPMGPDARWIELKIPGAETGLVIARPFQPGNIVGAFMNMAFIADDVQKTYEELSARGVEF